MTCIPRSKVVNKSSWDRRLQIKKTKIKAQLAQPSSKMLELKKF